MIVSRLRYDADKRTGAIQITDLYPTLQEVLVERSLEYMVAPFSACAQVSRTIHASNILAHENVVSSSRSPGNSIH
jgi:hypothetical protein